MTETIESANAAASTLFLGHNGEFWDFWLILSVVVAALSAISIGVTTTGSIISHKREAESAEKTLELFKLKTEKEISEANERTEKQRSKNITLQRAIQPRRIAMGAAGDGSVRTERFAEVARHPVTAFLVSVPDFEANILESDVEFALKKSGWTVVRRPDAVSFGLIMPGVHIVTLQDPPRITGDPPKMEMPAPTDATRAAFSLYKLLILDLGPPNGPGLGVMPSPEYPGMESYLKGSPLKLDDKSILICIGMKPVPSPDVPDDPPYKFE